MDFQGLQIVEWRTYYLVLLYLNDIGNCKATIPRAYDKAPQSAKLLGQYLILFLTPSTHISFLPRWVLERATPSRGSYYYPDSA